MKNIKFLNQSRFPGLWSLFQILIGGTFDKRRLYKMLQKNSGPRILEIGCSTGNTAEAFSKDSSIQYFGLDIDANAIAEAQRKFKNHRAFQFICSDLRDFVNSTDEKFDFILFGNIAHHIPDSLLVELLGASTKLMHENTVLAVVDPLQPENEDPWLIQFYARHLEKGEYLRHWSETENILAQMKTLRVVSREKVNIGASPLSWPLCARFSAHILKLEISQLR